MPNAVKVFSDTTKSIVAFGATIPATCTSRSASPSSPNGGPLIPGSGPFSMTVGPVAGVTPNKFRKAIASFGLMFESATIAICWPVPSREAGML